MFFSLDQNRFMIAWRNCISFLFVLRMTNVKRMLKILSSCIFMHALDENSSKQAREHEMIRYLQHSTCHRRCHFATFQIPLRQWPKWFYFEWKKYEKILFHSVNLRQSFFFHLMSNFFSFRRHFSITFNQRKYAIVVLSYFALQFFILSSVLITFFLVLFSTMTKIKVLHFEWWQRKIEEKNWEWQKSSEVHFSWQVKIHRIENLFFSSPR